MAKAGEGDERWIVDDLGSQGTNVSSAFPEEQIIFPQIVSDQTHRFHFMHHLAYKRDFSWLNMLL